MAIHDVDKNNDDRSSPAVNAHDAQDIAQRMAHGTTSINPVTDATFTSAFTQTRDGRMLVNDGTNPRVIVGAQPDGTFGMKVSQAGYDVTTATDSQMIFNSSQDVFKIAKTGTVNITGTSTSGAQTVTTTVAHNLGYQPAMLILSTAPAISSIQGGNGLLPLPLTYIQAGGTIIVMVQSRVDSTNLYIDFVKPLTGTTDLTSYTWSFKYYLLQETAN